MAQSRPYKRALNREPSDPEANDLPMCHCASFFHSEPSSQYFDWDRTGLDLLGLGKLCFLFLFILKQGLILSQFNFQIKAFKILAKVFSLVARVIF